MPEFEIPDRQWYKRVQRGTRLVYQTDFMQYLIASIICLNFVVNVRTRTPTPEE